jgi:hypothetical protein
MILSGIDTVSFTAAVSGGLLSSSALYTWNSEDLNYTSNQALKTWNGQWVSSNTDNLELLVPPIFASNTATAIRQVTNPTPENWEIIIEVVGEDFSDRITKLGVMESASDGFDPLLDYPEPPTPPGGQYIEAYFPHDDWSAILGSKYNFDIREPLDDGEEETWGIEIDGSITGAITLIWGDVSTLLPADYSAWLYVPATGNAYDMFTMDSIGINQELPFNAQIIVSSTYLSLSDILGLPTEFALHQNYPNPFNPTTTLRYDLPVDAMVNITIYDIMGRSIKSLVNSNQTAGYRSIRWDGKNNLGEGVSAGMYIYMIQAGEFRQTKKMVLLK